MAFTGPSDLQEKGKSEVPRMMLTKVSSLHRRVGVLGCGTRQSSRLERVYFECED